MNRRSGTKRRLWMNAAFAALLLLAAGLLWLAVRGGGEARTATVDFGMGITERIPLDTDHDYYYEVGSYLVRLEVRDGAVAFRDSRCPDHLCEGFGRLS